MADLDPGLAVLRDGAAGVEPMINLSPAAARERVVLGNRLCAAGPEVPVRDVAAGPDGPPVPVRIYEPVTVGRAKATLVYAHGGGWVTGDLDYADELCRFLAADAGVRVLSVDYRLAPDHPFPAGLDDLTTTWLWACEQFDGPMALGGDSSGGNLAAAVAHRTSRNDTRVAFLLLLYPVLGLPDSTPSYRSRAEAFPTGAADMRWFFAHYLAGVRPCQPGADLVPLHADDLSLMPRTHLVLAGHDPLHDEGAAFASALSSVSVPVSVAEHADLCHGFLRFTAASAAARDARSAVVGVVRRLAAGEAASPRIAQFLPMIQQTHRSGSGPREQATAEVNP